MFKNITLGQARTEVSLSQVALNWVSVFLCVTKLSFSPSRLFLVKSQVDPKYIIVGCEQRYYNLLNVPKLLFWSLRSSCNVSKL